MPQTGAKQLGDEEVARRLHEELNGPEASSPAAAATRRSRKAPAFYSPTTPGGAGELTLDEDGGPMDATGAQHDADARSPAADASERLDRLPPLERPLSSGLRRSSTKGSLDEQADKQSQASTRGRLRAGDAAGSLLPTTRSAFADDARTLRPEPRSAARPARSLGEVRSEDLAGLRTAGSRGAGDSTPGFGGSMASSSHASDQEQEPTASKGSKPGLPKVPRLPMCRHGQMWYRTRKVEENGSKVLLEFPGVEGLQPIWLPRDSPRIWTGSYKGKDWKHLGNGAWEPKAKDESPSKKPGSASRVRKRRLSAASTSDDEASEIDEKSLAAPDLLPATRRSRPALSGGVRDGAQPSSAEERDGGGGGGAASTPGRPHSAAAVDGPAASAVVESEAAPSPSVSRRRGRPPGKRVKKEAAATSGTLQQSNIPDVPDSPDSGAADDPTSTLVPIEIDTGDTVRPHSPPGGQLLLGGEAQWAPASPDGRADSRADTQAGKARRHRKPAAAVQRAEPARSDPDARAGPFSDAAEEPAAAEEAAAALLSVAPRQQAAEAEERSESPQEEAGDGAAAGRAGSPDAGEARHLSPLKVPGSGLGALAQALADASASRKLGQPPATPQADRSECASPDKAPGSSRSHARKRKRGLLPTPAPCKLPVVDEASCGGSGSGNSNPGSCNGRPSHDSPSSSDSDKRGGESWRMAFKEKHRQRLAEVEAEEEAAQAQELVSEEEDTRQPAQKPLSQRRGVRPVRTPRSATGLTGPLASDDIDALGTRASREIDGGGSPVLPRRNARGRGRWANHVKRGSGRGARPPQPSPSPQEPLRAARPGGRGRRGGRWGGRGSAAAAANADGEPYPGDEKAARSDIRIRAFGGIVDALEKKAEGLPFQGFPAFLQDLPRPGVHPCNKILEAPADRFAAYRTLEPADVAWSFKTQTPPVPLFK